MIRTQSTFNVILAAATLAGVVAISSHAYAGECPADQMRPDARTSGETAASGVSDNILGAIELNGVIQGLDGRALRLRKLVIQPGGVVPWHTHGDRPAIIMTVSGSITEYRSTCAVGIEHTAGDVTREYGNISHWWRNNGAVPTVLIAVDIKRDDMPPSEDHM
ncbi:MAG TPA: cupin domain-containing protein [Caulobacteraceae bacterium]|jgi:quercetin dioxygenase-like cupin family protein|nr:cupin domain-containing protein [Caulobacteraceae bacterium]